MKLNITFGGKTIKEWIKQIRREEFIKNEVRPGRILVTWVDIDSMVYGWNMNADEEMGLGLVAAKIAEAKKKKLIDIIEGGKNHDKEISK